MLSNGRSHDVSAAFDEEKQKGDPRLDQPLQSPKAELLAISKANPRKWWIRCEISMLLLNPKKVVSHDPWTDFPELKRRGAHTMSKNWGKMATVWKRPRVFFFFWSLNEKIYRHVEQFAPHFSLQKIDVSCWVLMTVTFFPCRCLKSLHNKKVCLL